MNHEVKLLIAVGVVTLGLLFGAVFFLSKSNLSQSSGILDIAPNSPLLVKPDSNQTASASAQSKVTLVEFGDYQCPSCEAVYPITKALIADYSHQINFVFRNFPLDQHPFAKISAEAAEAAGNQGKFWEMHDKLYESQNEWVNSRNQLETFVGYARAIGLDETQFRNDVNQNKYASKIQADIQDGIALGIDATPTFFVNGKPIVGSLSLTEFKRLIDAELKTQ